MEGKADRARDWYYRLRLTTIIGGVIIPALVSLNFTTEADAVVASITFSLSLLVAISAAVEEFFHFGERWRHYHRFENHAEAYRAFAARVEDINKLDVEAYITNVVREKQEEGDEKTKDGAGKA